MQNWQIYLGIGASGLLVTALFTFAIFQIMKSSDAYRISLAQVQSNSVAIDLLGTPIEPGWWMAGSIQVSGPSGSADISYPVHGGKATGTVCVRAAKSMGQWQLGALVLELKPSKQRHNLLGPAT